MAYRLKWSQGEPRIELPKPPVARAISGWALNVLARYDREGAWGLVAVMAIAGVLTRQAAFVVAACLDDDDIPEFLERLHIRVSGAEGIGIALRKRRAREVIAAVFACSPDDVPTGYLRALARIDEAGGVAPGFDPFASPSSYERLFELFAFEPHSSKTNALRYCGNLKSSLIDAVDALDPLLIWPEIVAKMGSAQSVAGANALMQFLRRSVSTIESGELIRSMRGSLNGMFGLEMFGRKVLERADRLPPPPLPPCDGFRPLTTAEDIRELGRRMENCAASKIVEVALGLLALYETSLRADDGTEYTLVVSLTPMMTGDWSIAEINGPKNKQPPADVRRAVLQRLQSLGVLIPGPPLDGPYQRDLASLLGAYRWAPLDDLLREDDTKTKDLDDLENVEDAA